MFKLGHQLDQWPRLLLILTVFCILGVVGTVDYLTGVEIFFSVFYLVAIGMATWFIGRNFGLLVSILSVAIWISGDLAAGAHYSSPFIPMWNAMILLIFYFIVVVLLASLRSLQRDLENRVQQRTIALTQEIAERQQLEKELLAIGEREQRRIGRDLHDNLCQHLTATALAGRVLEEKLAAQSLHEAPDANRIVELIEEGITLTRNLARGIYPVEMEAEGLMDALQELAVNTARWSKISCSFECDSPVLVNDANIATNLYRVAQEAIANAVRHGRPKQIMVSLSEQDGLVNLTVEDDGAGIPEGWKSHRGLGTRIMEHRLAMMNGSFSIEPNPTGGTLVKCSLPTKNI